MKWSEPSFGWSHRSLGAGIRLEAGYDSGSYMFRFNSIRSGLGYQNLAEAKEAAEGFARKVALGILGELGEE